MYLYLFRNPLHFDVQESSSLGLKILAFNINTLYY